DLDIPIWGVGLFYAQGYFIQRLDENGWQQEEFGTTDIGSLPMEKMLGGDGEPLVVEVASGDETIRAHIWRARVGRCHLVLLDTDVDGNTDEHRQITNRLYWGDQTSRILQEVVLGIGGLRALRLLGVRPGVFHLNEGHSAFALLEAARQEMEENDCGVQDALRRIGAKSVFTTHTPVPAGHDRFPAEMLLQHLGWLRDALGLSDSELLALGRVDPDASDERFCMTVLALRIAHRANGVAALHGHVSREMWQGLWPRRRSNEVPIGHVTNGVHTRSWMAPQLAVALERRLGTDWTRRTSRQKLWRHMDRVAAGEIWENHQILKADLIEFVRRRYAEQEARKGVPTDTIRLRGEGLLDPDALTLGFARRFATYKRATLMFRDRDRLVRLLTNPDRPVQLVFAGKSHPRDGGGKELIQQIARLQHEEPFQGRVVFLENYDINVARHLVQGVDVWVNNPVRPEEACGTSGMKATLNGVLNLSIADGWWAEAFDGQNGFLINSSGPHADPAIQDARDHEALLSALETEVIPAFFDRDENGLPLAWLERVRWAFMTLAWRFSADRMVMDYVRDAYLPAALGDSCRM
ncbi:MAG: alpha-glucan phosphorylase, partial [Planctomycetes bacterium]|nr:alpha-glucan phosphorylase [Planctomycetota bacterium]